MKGALNTLSQELNPHKAILEAEPKYRKNLAQSLLYKTILSIIYETLDEKMKSAVENEAADATNTAKDMAGEVKYAIDDVAASAPVVAKNVAWC